MDNFSINRNRADFGSDKIAADYNEKQLDYPDEVRQEILSCLTRNAPHGVARRFMLDVGCGGGKSTKLFANDFERVLGIDISQAQIDVAKRNITQSNVSFQVVNDNLFPVDDNSTDLVFCGIAFHYLDPPVFFAECDRVLVEGGLVACTMYSHDILKSLNGRVICDYSVKPSKWEHAQREYGKNCGIDQNVGEILFSRYEEAFKSIKNPTKRRIQVVNVDRNFTVAEFMRFQATVSGYAKKSYPDPKLDPLNIYRGRIAEIFQDAGMACEDDTEFIATFVFTAMIIEKTKTFGIA